MVCLIHHHLVSSLQLLWDVFRGILHNSSENNKKGCRNILKLAGFLCTDCSLKRLSFFVRGTIQEKDLIGFLTSLRLVNPFTKNFHFCFPPTTKQNRKERIRFQTCLHTKHRGDSLFRFRWILKKVNRKFQTTKFPITTKKLKKWKIWTKSIFVRFFLPFVDHSSSRKCQVWILCAHQFR